MDSKENQDTGKDESHRVAMEDNKPKEEDASLSEGESSSMEMHLHPIKSTAVVKYSASQSPAHFAKLQCNTDLNMPPSNWLSSSAEPYGLHYFPSHSTGFSSFKMAHMFPDCVGEVDVVSDAENIKKLLKIPYSRGPVSMMVHRIENTLLIDDFDIHKHLLITAKKEWEWLKKFFFNHVLTSLDTKEKGLFQKNKTRGAVQERSLVSKFLYHSLASDPVETPKPQSVEVNKTKYSNIKGSRESTDPGAVFTSESTPLPEPREEEAVPDAVSSHNFTRNVVWTFEDIQMLIGTDMPIFGGSTHPCISLRLREMTRPINVLTGLDYWLDNLMCNVPEVVMCYHLAGIVQRYELIKTEDLPHLPNSKFSPKLIRDVAQNILSFLKSNATKAGHTYWLFRGKDDDIVKLYDLTSLCTDILDDRGQNPFTVPVGMLLYRVARNMKNPKPNKRQQATMQTLLTNCLSLLAKEKYPKIVASAHYMLSDLYVPAQMDPESPNPNSRSGEKEDEVVINSQSDEEGPKEDDFEEQDGMFHSPVSKTQEDCAERKVAVQSLCISKRFMRGERHKRRRSAKRGAAPLTEGMSTKDRCLLALDHIATGLSCLRYLKPTDPSSDECDSSNEPKKRFSDEEPKMARPYQPIPMPYSRLGEEADKEPEKENRNKTADGDVKQKSGEVTGEPWGDILRGLLYEKAGFVFAKLTDFENQSGNFGVSLRMVMNALQCCKVLNRLRGENLKGCGGIVKGQHRKKGDGVNGRWDDLDEIRANVLSRAGDAAFMIVKQWKELESYKNDFIGCISESEGEIKSNIEDVLAQNGLKKKSNISPLVLREEWKTNSTKLLKSGGELASSFIGEEELLLFISQSLSGSIEEMLLVSCCCYQTAFTLTRTSTHAKPGKSDSQLAVDAQRDVLVQRLGNIHNELGALYNGKFQANIMQEDDAPEKNTSSPVQLSSLSLKELARLSSEHFDAGIKAFSFIKDRQNMALLHSNLGRLMQLQAHRCGVKARLMGLNQLDKKYSWLKQEKIFYNKAVESYQRALDILNKREEHPEIWDAVASGLSSALFNQAIHLNDPLSKHPAKMGDDGEEVIEAFKKALKSCEVETDDIRTPFYQYRAATIHHHLAVKFYDKFRALTSSTEVLDDHFKHHKRKGGGRLDGIKARGNLSQRNLQMANQHYEKSAQLLMELEHPTEYLRVLIERIALEEYLCSTVESKQQIARHYSAVKLILGCKKILEVLIERNEGKCDDSQKIGKEPITSEGMKDASTSSRKQPKGDGSESGGSDKLSSTSSDSLHADNEQEVCDELGDSMEEQVEILDLLQSIKGKLQTHLLKLAQLGSSHNKEVVEPVKKMYRFAIEINLEKDDEAKKPAQKIVSLSVQLRLLILKLEEETKRSEFSCLE